MKKFFLYFFCTILILIISLVATLTITEFRPHETEALECDNTSSFEVEINKPINAVTWNVGYCGLSENADFFMDGGKSVKSSDKQTVSDNLSNISNTLIDFDSDIIMLQELDRSSTRSYYIDEYNKILSSLSDYTASFANNYKCLFVPYPLPPIGKVNSGIASFSKYNISSAQRQSLYVPFKWPVRVANLKRCLLISRLPIKNSDKELVVINAHLEAYDDGTGKAKQFSMLADIIKSEYDKGNYVIAGGDFNQTFSKTDLSSFYISENENLWHPAIINEDEFLSGFSFLMDNKVPSCRSLDRPFLADDESFQFYVIDGFILSENIEITEMYTEDLSFKNSDHNPVRLSFTLK